MRPRGIDRLRDQRGERLHLEATAGGGGGVELPESYDAAGGGEAKRELAGLVAELRVGERHERGARPGAAEARDEVAAGGAERGGLGPELVEVPLLRARDRRADSRFEILRRSRRRRSSSAWSSPAITGSSVAAAAVVSGCDGDGAGAASGHGAPKPMSARKASRAVSESEGKGRPAMAVEVRGAEW